MAKCALPLHLSDRLHDDWIFPFNKISRAWNAYGPRCPGSNCTVCGGKSRLPWPPVLVEGRGVSRWEAFGPGHSILHVKILDDITIKGSYVYGQILDGIEMNPGLPLYGKIVRNRFTVDGPYHPSALQEFSKKGWMKLEPDYYAWWYRINNKYTMNHREKYRPDSEDIYYNKSIVGYNGLRFE